MKKNHGVFISVIKAIVSMLKEFLEFVCDLIQNNNVQFADILLLRALNIDNRQQQRMMSDENEI